MDVHMFFFTMFMLGIGSILPYAAQVLERIATIHYANIWLALILFLSWYFGRKAAAFINRKSPQPKP